MKIHYINLTNGIEAIKEHNLINYRFIRIQSTHCEQKRWDDILNNISDDFLMNVALGNECIVYDYGANKKISRAVWQGLEWIKFCLYKIWYDSNYKLEGRSNKSDNYFHEQFINLDKKTLKRIKYYRKFLSNKEINITSVTNSTSHDNDINFYKNILKGNN